MKTVFVAAYKGTETDDIIGVFNNITDAKAAIHRDFKQTRRMSYTPDVEEVEDNHIYMAKKNEWYDEWYITETEIFDRSTIREEIDNVLRQMCFGNSRQYCEEMVDRIFITDVINDQCIEEQKAVDEDMVISALMEIVLDDCQ
jgi:hypothetical protein